VGGDPVLPNLGHVARRLDGRHNNEGGALVFAAGAKIAELEAKIADLRIAEREIRALEKLPARKTRPGPGPKPKRKLPGWGTWIRTMIHRGDGAKTGAGRFLSHAEIAGSCAPGPWAKPASIGFRPAVARCCKIGSRPNPDRAVERHMARESFHEGEDGRRYGVMIINFRSCSAERCRPRPSEAAFLRLQSRRSLGDLTNGEIRAAAVNIGRTVDPRSSPDAPPMELPRHAPS
jgi:hypothetical protein